MKWHEYNVINMIIMLRGKFAAGVVDTGGK